MLSVHFMDLISDLPEQPLNFALKEAWQFSSGKGYLYLKKVNLYWNFGKGTTANAQGTTAIAVGAMS